MASRTSEASRGPDSPSPAFSRALYRRIHDQQGRTRQADSSRDSPATNEKVVMVAFGRTGLGKSTTLNKLLGFAVPTCGRLQKLWDQRASRPRQWQELKELMFPVADFEAAEANDGMRGAEAFSRSITSGASIAQGDTLLLLDTAGLGDSHAAVDAPFTPRDMEQLLRIGECCALTGKSIDYFLFFLGSSWTRVDAALSRELLLCDMYLSDGPPRRPPDVEAKPKYSRWDPRRWIWPEETSTDESMSADTTAVKGKAADSPKSSSPAEATPLSAGLKKHPFWSRVIFVLTHRFAEPDDDEKSHAMKTVMTAVVASLDDLGIKHPWQGRLPPACFVHAEATVEQTQNIVAEAILKHEDQLRGPSYALSDVLKGTCKKCGYSSDPALLAKTPRKHTRCHPGLKPRWSKTQRAFGGLSYLPLGFGSVMGWPGWTNSEMVCEDCNQDQASEGCKDIGEGVAHEYLVPQSEVKKPPVAKACEAGGK